MWFKFYVGLDGHWYLRGPLDNLWWRSPWRKPEGWNGRKEEKHDVPPQDN